MGRQITFEERDQLDSYKAKDYAQNYDTVTGGTSRDLENYSQSNANRYQPGKVVGGLGEAVPYSGSGGLREKPKGTARIDRKGEIVMDEAELQA